MAERQNLSLKKVSPNNLATKHLSSGLPWGAEKGENRRFVLALLVMVAVFLPPALLIPAFQLPEPDRSEAEKIPPQLARLVEQREPPKPFQCLNLNPSRLRNLSPSPNLKVQNPKRWSRNWLKRCPHPSLCARHPLLPKRSSRRVKPPPGRV